MVHMEKSVKLENIEFLINGNGEVTLGRCGPVQCAAIEDAYERDIYADEINT